MKSLTHHQTLFAVAASVVTFAMVMPAQAKRRDTGNNASENSNSGNGSNADKKTPIMPEGALSATPKIVQTGAHPIISWNVNVPSIVEDYVTITPPSTITADECVEYEVRVIGAGVTVGNSQGFSFVPTEATMKHSTQSYERIFFGTNHDVQPSQVVSSGTLSQNQTLKFGGRYFYNGVFGPSFNADGGTQNIRTLVNGDVPPNVLPEYNAPSLESFIKPYLGANNIVRIGPMDCIVFMELTHTDSQSNNAGYDLQDMVLLVTFKSCKNNNGHGNNIDGIDSSNPGNAPFIDLDTDPNVDDER